MYANNDNFGKSFVAAKDWDTSFANAQIFTTLQKAKQDRKHKKYWLASNSQWKAWSKAFCKHHKRRPGQDAEEEGDHVTSILNLKDSLIDWNKTILIS